MHSVTVIFFAVALCSVSTFPSPQNVKLGENVDITATHDDHGSDLGAAVTRNLWKSEDGQTQLNGQATYNQHFGGPLGKSDPILGAGVNAVHQFPDNRGNAAVSAHQNKFGTDVGANLDANLWRSRDGRSELNGQANYNQHFGGPSGHSRPNYGAGLIFNHRFQL